MENGMDLELCIIIINVCSKVNGKMIINTVKVFKNYRMDVLFKEPMLMENLKVLEDILGLMVNFIKDNG
jgi:hypothetical protein